MAGYTNAGTKNSIPSAQIPTGYTRPTVVETQDYKFVYTLTLSVLKVTVDEAVAATTMTAIIENVTIGISKQVDDIVALDFDSDRQIDYYTVWAPAEPGANIVNAGTLGA